MSQLVRTQIYLPVKLKQAIKGQAKLRNRSFSDVLRTYLQEKIEEQDKKERVNGASILLQGALDAEKRGHRGPLDLAVNHDYYLYGDGSPKFGGKNMKTKQRSEQN